MSTPRTNPAAPLPRWVVLAGSAVIVFHFFAIATYVLSAPSGPWPLPPPALGSSPALSPFFLRDPNRPPNDFSAREIYLRLLHLDHDYHFQSNHTDLSAVYFEARLKDKAGNEIATLKFPQDKVNFWVRHRQGLLGQGLGDDRPVEGSRGNPIAAPGQKSRDIPIWERVGGKGDNFKLIKKPSHTINAEQELMGPSSRSYLLAKSYARYLGRKHDAASVELIRHSRNPILPDIVFTNRLMQLQGVDQKTPYILTDMVANFGVEEIRDEK